MGNVNENFQISTSFISFGHLETSQTATLIILGAAIRNIICKQAPFIGQLGRMKCMEAWKVLCKIQRLAKFWEHIFESHYAITFSVGFYVIRNKDQIERNNIAFRIRINGSRVSFVQ